MDRGRVLVAACCAALAVGSPAAAGDPNEAAATWGMSCRHAFAAPPASGSGDRLLEGWPDATRSALLEAGFTRPVPVASELADCGGFLQAAVVFERPPAQVIALLTQTHRRGEFIASLHKVASVERGEAHSVDEQQIKVLFTKLRYYMRSEWSAERGIVSWTLDPGREHDIERLDGYWHLHPLSGGRTLGIYGTRVSVGSLIPARTQQRLSRKKMTESLGHIRGWVNSNGTYRP